MRSLFTAPPAAAAPVAVPASRARGLDAVPGKAKLAVGGVVLVGIVGLAMMPGLYDAEPPKDVTKNQEPHAASQINEYGAPEPQLVMARTANPFTAAQAAPMMRRRPVPTEMALYVPSASAAGQAPVRTASADPGRTADDAMDPGQTTGAPGMGGARAGGQADPLAASLGGATRLPTMRATLVRNPDFLIRPGATIPCIQVPAMDSSLPGFVSCRVDQWYPGSTLRRGLLPPGTIITGQMRNGLSGGQERIGVVFTQIQTPHFDIELAAPAADSLGRTGLEADVKTFFWDKVGAVALYALMDVGIGAGQNLASSAMSRAFNGNGGGTTLNLGGQAQGLASQQFGATINRPPVGTRPEAVRLSVVVAQTLDFSDGCRRAMAVNPMACPAL